MHAGCITIGRTHNLRESFCIPCAAGITQLTFLHLTYVQQMFTRFVELCTDYNDDDAIQMFCQSVKFGSCGMALFKELLIIARRDRIPESSGSGLRDASLYVQVIFLFCRMRLFLVATREIHHAFNIVVVHLPRVSL